MHHVSGYINSGHERGLRIGAFWYIQKEPRKMRAHILLSDTLSNDRLAVYEGVPAKYDYQGSSQYKAQIPVNQDLAPVAPAQMLAEFEYIGPDGRMIRPTCAEGARPRTIVGALPRGTRLILSTQFREPRWNLGGVPFSVVDPVVLPSSHV